MFGDIKMVEHLFIDSKNICGYKFIHLYHKIQPREAIFPRTLPKIDLKIQEKYEN